MIFGCVPFSGEKRVNLIRRALPEVNGWRLLAPTANTRSMLRFCAAVDTAACATHVSNLNISGFALRILPISSNLFFFVLPIDIRLSGIRYQVFDTAHIRSISIIACCSQD